MSAASRASKSAYRRTSPTVILVEMARAVPRSDSVSAVAFGPSETLSPNSIAGRQSRMFLPVGSVSLHVGGGVVGGHHPDARFRASARWVRTAWMMSALVWQ